MPSCIRTPFSYEMLSGSIGYVQILNFHSGTAEAAISAIETLLTQGAEASSLTCAQTREGW